MAEINVEFVSYRTDRDVMVPTQGAAMTRGSLSDASRATVTGTALAGGARITVPTGYTTALVTAIGDNIRVAIGSDPTADPSSNLIMSGQTQDFPVLPGQLISAILNANLA